ncbi:putative transcription factor interactor and regulator CCHC(Zn) family [Helianthus anomalus]
MSSKREMLEQEFEGFSYSYGETIEALIGRFAELLTEMEKAEMVVSTRISNRKLLEPIKGIPDQANCSWFINVNQIIVTTDGNCYKMKPDELISLIKSYDNADKQKRNEAYRLHNAELIQDYNDIKNKKITLSKNEKLYKDKIEAQRKDIIKLKDDVSVKTTHFLEAQEKVCILTKELEDIRERYQINELNIKKFDSSSKLVKNLCDQQLAYKKKKGCGLGFNQVPPPYNDNYTYLPMTEEELMNEDKMAYGPKTDKSSINSRPVDKEATPLVNLVSKGTFDPNASSSLADEVKVEGVVENEQASSSHVCDIFGSFLQSMLKNVRPDGLGENVDACVRETESANETNEPAEPSDSKRESPEAAVSEKLESVDSSEFSSRVSCAEPSCADNSSNVSVEVAAKVSGISSDKPEPSNSVKDDDMKDEEKTNVNIAPSAQAEQSEPSVSDEKVQIKQQEPKRVGKGRGKKKPKHQRQAGSPQSSTGSNSPQKARVVKNAFVKPVSNGKCEKYAFDCANKAFRKTSEFSKQDLQYNQNKKNQKKSQPQKAPANDKYRHPNSSSSARNVQQNQAQKGPVRPSGPGRANPADQNAFHVKRQTCFNCGIAGHISRNCTHCPYVPYYMQNQRVTPKGNYHSKPMKVSSPTAMKNVNPKVKPSDGDWNVAKNKRKVVQEQKSVFKTNKPEPVKVAQPKATNTFVKPKQIWKPKSKAATSPILETKGDLCLKEVSYFDASGNPRTTMAWVPMSY